MGRLGTVIQAMNSQLGTCFAPFVDGDPHTGEQLQVILDGWSTTIFGDRAAMATARPSDARHAALEDARAAVRAPPARSDRGPLRAPPPRPRSGGIT